ncbi:hypothetical protein [Curtobacterium flaccumfaciens]|uniref:hypothetical protein n=1 Tax=Curtobacterium flaccumfaciens TaxID=2035 RepID=UPI001601CA2E|nr:hypothetical protein [Curtobacterium flaccumfaciens]MBB1195855.1 hypothetical protein [Curtobacterium flaccumfaciens]
MFGITPLVAIVIYVIHEGQLDGPYGWWVPADVVKVAQDILAEDANHVIGGLGLAAAAIPVLLLGRSTYELAATVSALISATIGFGADKTLVSLVLENAGAVEGIPMKPRLILVGATALLSILLAVAGWALDAGRTKAARMEEASTQLGLQTQRTRDAAVEDFERRVRWRSHWVLVITPSAFLVFAVLTLCACASVSN